MDRFSDGEEYPGHRRRFVYGAACGGGRFRAELDEKGASVDVVDEESDNAETE